MRNLLKAMILGTLVMSLMGCGKEEGGGSSSSSSSVIGNGSGTAFTTFDTLKSAFTNSGFNEGVTNNTAIYHVGDIYGGSSINTSSGAALCFFGENILGDDDLCNNNIQNPNDLNSIISNGEFKTIRSSSSSSISYGVASGVSNGTFTYDEQTFDVNNEIYRKMLNLDNKVASQIVVTEATINMSVSGSIRGNFVEYFYQDGTYEAYIVSSALSKIANPVVSYIGTYSVGSVANITNRGRLSNDGTDRLTGVSAQYHILINDFTTGQLSSQVGGRITL